MQTHDDAGPRPRRGRGHLVLQRADDHEGSMAETGGAYSLTEHLVTAASNPPMHVQVDEDEAFYMLDGEVEFEVDGDVVVGDAGHVRLRRPGRRAPFRVLTDTARMLVICSGKPTDNLEDFFLGMGEPATERALPDAGGTGPGPPRRRCTAQTGIELV